MGWEAPGVLGDSTVPVALVTIGCPAGVMEFGAPGVGILGDGVSVGVPGLGPRDDEWCSIGVPCTAG